MEILFISFIGAVILMDTTAAFQIQISQPLISSVIIGWLLNDIAFGLHIGILMQLLWLSSIPVGATVIPAGNFGTISATALGVMLNREFSAIAGIIVLVVVVYGIFMSYIGAKIIQANRTWNVSFINKAITNAGNGKLGAIRSINIQALTLHFSISFLMISGSVFLGFIIFRDMLGLVPHEWNNYIRFIEICLLGIGAGLTFSLYKNKKLLPWLGISAIIGIIIFIFTA